MVEQRPLKILIANKFYHPFGGSESYMFGLKKLLEERGHSVVVFSMKHPDNLPSPQSKYFVRQADYSNLEEKGFFKRLHMAARIIYSIEARRKMAALVRDEKPDIAHFLNIYHQLSPSIITPLKKRGIPIVMKLADYKLLCLNYTFVHRHKQCDACRTGSLRTAIRKRCVKDSAAATMVNYIEHYVHKYLRSYENIDLLLAPSNFLREKHIEKGVNPSQIITFENFKDLSAYQPHYDHDRHILYFGRVEKEKGIKTLVDAMLKLPDIPLKIVGSGHQLEAFKEYARRKGAENVEFTGFQTGERLKELITRCVFSIVPSEWYENCSNTVIEAFAYGKPVIGSDIGGIPEQVIDGRNGFLFEPGNASELAERIRRLYGDAKLIREMGEEGRRTVETKYSEERHYAGLMKIYGDLIARKTAGKR